MVKPLTIACLALMLSGCANAVRDTWTGGNLDQLQTAHSNCFQKSNRDTLNDASDIPAPVTMLHRARYKDCMERSGYTKLQTEEISLKSTSTCGQSNQTCFVPLNAR